MMVRRGLIYTFINLIQNAKTILSSTANATLFLISSFKYENNMKTFVCDYHVKDPTRLPFCIIKFKFVVRMRECLPRGTKVHFLCFACTGS